MDGVPCRVSADLRQHQAEQELADRLAEPPDFADDDAYRGIIHEDLAKPLAQLFSTRDQVKQLQRSEAFSDRKALEWVMKDLAAVEEEFRRLWEAS